MVLQVASFGDLPVTGINDSFYITQDESKGYYWNPGLGQYVELKKTVVVAANLAALPATGIVDVAYATLDGHTYVWQSNPAQYIEVSTFIDSTVTDGYATHIQNDLIHTTQADKDNWNNGITELTDHENNAIIHTTQAQKDGWDAAVGDLATHVQDNVKHTTATDRNNWDTAANNITQHAANTTIHTSDTEKAAWDQAATDLTTHIADGDVHTTPAKKNSWDGGVADLATHAANNAIHVSDADRTAWNGAITALGAEITARQNGDNTNAGLIATEGVNRANGDTAINSRIDALGSLGHSLGSVATFADLPTTVPTEAAVNDFITVRADENNNNDTTRYVLTDLSPVTWVYDYTINKDISGKMDKLTTPASNKVVTSLANGNTEESDKEIADLATVTALATETAARAAGDTANTTALDNHIADNVKHVTATERSNWDGAVVNLATEVANRTSGDTTLQTNIEAEATDRGTAVTALTAAISAEVTARGAAITSVQGDLATEATARAAGDVLKIAKVPSKITGIYVATDATAAKTYSDANLTILVLYPEA